ncbi:MAG: hypothetical protein A2Y38_04740 [Spirochaetes bacterium GWB1_59_5]|nr:MAG: hypothetical protein A2Y38_04740 [Spirochaetes bacterium GWB1_59_5]
MIESKDIFIDSSPFCFWGNDLSKDNIAFLKQIDSNYYFTMAEKLDVVFEQAFSDTPTVLGWQRRCGISPEAVAGHFHGLPDVNRSYGME